MKFTISQPDLAAVLAKGGAVAKKNATIAILSNVRLFVADDLLSVASTDLDRFAEARTPVELSEPGCVTVPAAGLAALIGRQLHVQFVQTRVTHVVVRVGALHCQQTGQNGACGG